MVANFPRCPRINERNIRLWVQWKSKWEIKIHRCGNIFSRSKEEIARHSLSPPEWEIPTCNFRKIVSSNHQKKEKNVKNRLKKNPGHGKFCDDKLWRIFKKKIMNKAIKYIRKPLSFLKCTWIFYIGFIPMNYLISSR